MAPGSKTILENDAGFVKSFPKEHPNDAQFCSHCGVSLKGGSPKKSTGMKVIFIVLAVVVLPAAVLTAVLIFAGNGMKETKTAAPAVSAELQQKETAPTLPPVITSAAVPEGWCEF